MNDALLSPKTLHVANEVLRWAQEYLMAPNPNISRPYPSSPEVCPFVRPSVDNDSFYMAFYPDVHEGHGEDIKNIMLGYIPTFKFLRPVASPANLKKALLVIFPGIQDKQGAVLDMIHEQIKPAFIQAQLMVGQFHPHCDEPSVHNSVYPVNRSPYPLMAMRHMAKHDIIFIQEHEDPDWFDVYNRLFGDHFKDANLPEHEKYLQGIWRRLRKKFGE
jgi:heptaprenyl diphosphate synthase